ncbi:MAG: AMP-binding protein [Acidobacteriota bacterium]|nr:AMP-binding protein [Acidobacteriota bacterium]
MSSGGAGCFARPAVIFSTSSRAGGRIGPGERSRGVTGNGRRDAGTAGRQVLALTGDLLAELRQTGGRVPVALDERLEQDLGIGSLERVELLQRIERAFGVRLSDDTMAGALTPADLVQAILAAGPVIDEPPPAAPDRAAPVAAVPVSAATLVEVLRWHAGTAPDRIHVHLRDDSGHETPITYGALWQGASAVAADLRGRSLGRGETVALMLRTERAFFETFFGVLLAGGVPVPLYPPFRADRIEEYIRRQVGILRNADARLLVTFGEAGRVGSLLKGQVPALQEVLDAATLARHRTAGIGVTPGGADLALIQYTSGSTGDPKGVALSHANLLANIRSIGEALAIGPGDAGVSWLPLYHDMGLIGSWLGALYFGVPIAILSPLAFLTRPVRWLRAIHAHRATISAAPNFAFDLCARRIPDEDLQGLDLSCWRLALNGSEAVSAETLERFTARFAPYGFRSDALCPVYGLAESSVGLTATPPGRGPRVDLVARPWLQQGIARPAAAGDRAPARIVSCGRPLPGHAVRVVDAEGHRVAERTEGHVQFQGPSVMAGYYRNAAATDAIRHDGWTDSGDLGYEADGELFITGREKDVIIQAGRNVYPAEIEEIVATVPGIRAGCVAAFGVADAARGTERLVVVAETREQDPAARDRLQAGVRDAVVSALGVTPDLVALAAPGSVLKTSSGKIRRRATRDAYVAGRLARPAASAGAQWLRLALADLRGRAARLAATIGSVAYTAWVLLLLGATLPVLWIVLRLRPAGRAADRAARGWARTLLRAAGCRVRVRGAGHLRAGGPVILAANHASYIDPIVLMAALPVEFRFAAKQALTAYPMIGLVIRRCGYLTIDKADLAGRLAGADRLVRTTGDGLPLLVFPEGTFVRAPGVLPFRLGAFRAAAEAGLPVVPVAIAGTRHILPDGTWRLRRGRIDIEIGAPIRPQGAAWTDVVRLRDRTRQQIAEAVGEQPVSGT